MERLPDELRSAFKPLVENFSYSKNVEGVLETNFMGGNIQKQRLYKPLFNGTLSASLKMSINEYNMFMVWGKNALDNFTKMFVWDYQFDSELKYMYSRFVVDGGNTIVTRVRGVQTMIVSFQIDIRDVQTEAAIPEEYCGLIDEWTYDEFAEFIDLMSMTTANNKIAINNQRSFL